MTARTGPTVGLHFGHDAGAALVDRGKLHVIEAERQLGYKHVCGGNRGFPDGLTAWLEQLARRAGRDVLTVAMDDYYTPVCQVLPPQLTELVDDDLSWAHGRRLADSVMRRIEPVGWKMHEAVPEAELVVVRHHFAHAALAYYTSGADRSLVLVLDGTGNYAECGMVCLGEGDGLHPVLSFDNRSGPRFGLIYEALARRVHGGQFDTGKLLGLSAAGDVDEELRPVLSAMMMSNSARAAAPDLFEVIDERALAGSALGYDGTWWDWDPECGGYLDRYVADVTDDELLASYVVFPDVIRTATGREIAVGGSPGDAGARNVAATLQQEVETGILALARGLADRYPGYSHASLGGGCALNIIANTTLAQAGPFDRVHVPTCCDDSGIALGAALAASAPAERPDLSHAGSWTTLAFAGPGLVATTVRDLSGRSREFASDEQLIHHVARLLADRGTVAWLEGGMETGPRALGHRSLLVSPHWRGARRQVSELIKGREWFRPVAPMCPVEVAADYFAGPLASTETMLFAARIRDEKADALAEVRHLDGTARLQTVHPAALPRLHHLCHAVGELTGLPILINTSANGAGRPILNTLDEVLTLMDETPLDAAVLADPRLVVTTTTRPTTP